MNMPRLISVFRRKPVLFVSTTETSQQEALKLLRHKAEVLREQATHFYSGSTIYSSTISRADQAEEAVRQCEQLLACQNYRAVRMILLGHGIDTPVSSR
jgi:hypothetical protein